MVNPVSYRRHLSLTEWGPGLKSCMWIMWSNDLNVPRLQIGFSLHVNLIN